MVFQNDNVRYQDSLNLLELVLLCCWIHGGYNPGLMPPYHEKVMDLSVLN